MHYKKVIFKTQWHGGSDQGGRQDDSGINQQNTYNQLGNQRATFTSAKKLQI